VGYIGHISYMVTCTSKNLWTDQKHQDIFVLFTSMTSQNLYKNHSITSMVFCANKKQLDIDDQHLRTLWAGVLQGLYRNVELSLLRPMSPWLNPKLISVAESISIVFVLLLFFLTFHTQIWEFMSFLLVF
jgi:hypothetical protein